MKKLCLILMMFMMAFCTACSNSAVQNAGKELEDSITGLKDADNQYVKMVKGGHPNNNPNVTYDQAFTKFFGTPRWKYFKSDENQDVVEFTGDCTYQDVEVKARIQFVVDKENETFEATYLAFNEVPQSNLIMLAMLEKIFEDSENTTANDADGASSLLSDSPVYDVDELALRLGTRQGSLYEEGAPLYGKYEQCESISTDSEYGVKYGDLTVLGSRALDGDIVQFSTTNPKTFQKNGISLDKNEAELTAIFGEAEFGGQEQGLYYLTFLCDGYSLSVKSNDPTEAPYEIIVHY